MALANYTDLLASVASWMNRTDLTAVIPDFVTIAESRIARDLRHRKQLVSDTLTASTSTRAVALPSDWLEFSNLTIDGTPDAILQAVTMEHLNANYPEAGYSAKPIVFAVDGDNVLFGPLPDDAYTVNIDYFARFPALATDATNWLMTNHPKVYLAACMAEAASFTFDPQRAAEWNAIYKGEIAELQKDDDASAHSGSVLRVKKK
jgi:hypothetical protein